MLDRNSRTLLIAAGRAANLTAAQMTTILSVAEGQERTGEPVPKLMTQAQKARQLSVSRFTIRKMTQLGKLHVLELLPGLRRYYADELVADVKIEASPPLKP
jgi:hypothetical protein